MDLNQGLVDLVAVALVAALAPLIVAVLPGPRVPQVVILLIGGVLIGPHVLGVAETSNIQLLANIGLGFLFLLAGYELDPQLLRQRPGRLAIVGWLILAVLAVGVTAGLGAAGYVRDYVPIGLALTTTALGTLLPILRDNDMLGGSFGQYVFLLLAIASRFGLDVVLGALLAGIVLRAWTRRFNMDTVGLEHKFDAVGYGIFIPIFFVSSGMTLDLKAIAQNPLRLLTFFLLLLVVRGLPSLLVYRRALPVRRGWR